MTTNDVNIDICKQTTELLNQHVIPDFNILLSNFTSGLNTSINGIRTGILATTSGIDFLIAQSTNAFNTSINAIDNSTKEITNLFTILGTIFNVDSFFDFFKLIIALIILTAVPSTQIDNVSFYATAGVYALFFMIFIFPILFIILMII
jgi:hypothetical protein